MPISFASPPAGSSGISFGSTGGDAVAPISFAPGGGPGESPTIADKFGGFVGSTLESFPELFGIEPSEATQTYRAQNPVGSFLSQALGAFVPYAGAGKGLRALKFTRGIIEGAEGLSSKPFISSALGSAAEAGLTEVGRLGISATPLPSAIYEGLTGKTPETRPFGEMAGESLVNIGGSAVLGGALGALGSRFAKPPNLHDLVPGMNPDNPLVTQIRSADDFIKAAQDPANPLKVSDDTLGRVAAERDQRIKWNLMDVDPNYGDTGETTASGAYRQNQGKIYRLLEGDDEKNTVSRYMNNLNKWDTKTDNLTQKRRVIYDPLERGGYDNYDDLVTDLRGIAGDPTADPNVVRTNLGTYMQDVKVIEVKEGVGKKPKPANYASPLDWIRNKVGEIQDFYHGTTSDINDWQVGKGGGISFSTDPDFASMWSLLKSPLASASGMEGEGARVYITAIKADKNKVGDFKNPEDVKKAIIASSGDPENPALQKGFASGQWNNWENLAMLKKAGWETVYMVESPNAAGVTKARNIFVTNGDHIYSAYDPQVRWAKALRLHASEPIWNKPTSKDPAQGRSNGLQKKFNNSKVFADVGDGWKLAKERDLASGDGLYVMAKKVRGDPAVAAKGDRWAIGRTDRPDVFASKAARTDAILMRSAYFPEKVAADAIADPMFQAAQKFMAGTKDVMGKQGKALPDNALGKALGMAKDSGETIGTYGSTTHFLGTRNPMLARPLRLLRELKETADGRVSELMRGVQQQLPGKSMARGLLSFKPNITEGLENRIMELGPKDLDAIQFVDDAGLKIDQVHELASRHDINGEPIIPEKAHAFIQALHFLAGNYADRFEALQNAGLGADAANMISTFTRREGHNLLTREYPGAYKQLLNDGTGAVRGIASGDTPKQALDAADKLIEYHGKRGLDLTKGGFIDEVMRDPGQLAAMKRKYNRPGFIKARGTMLGYELQRGNLDTIKLRDIIERNLQRRENTIRNMAIVEHVGDSVAQLQRRSPQDAIALQKRIDLLVNHDEGAFATAQNAIVDKALHAVGFSGKDNATKIVQESQRLLSHFAFNFLSLSQPIQNILGVFQNLLPNLSFVVNASDETLARHYVTYPLMNGANSIKGSLGVLSEVKLMGRAIKRLGMNESQMEPDFKALLSEMLRRGLVAPRFADAYGIDGAVMRDPVQMWRSTKSFSRFLGSLNSSMMAKTEEIARGMTVNAYYDIAKLRGMDFDQMVRFTSEGIAKVNFNYSTVDKATVFTTPLGSLAGTFKNWMFHYIGNMLEFASEGKEGLPAFMWQTAATAALGGAAATPFLLPIANGASQFLTNQSAMQSLYSAAGFLGIDDRVADGIMYGLPGTLGLSLTSQFASPGSDPKRDAQMIFSFAALDRVKALSAATKDALVAYRASGSSPWEDEIVRTEMVRAFAPRTIYRAMQLTQDRAVKSVTTGYDVTKPLGLGEALLYAGGVSPVELQKTYEVYSQIKDKEADTKALTQQLGQTMQAALEAGDDRLANRVFVRAMALGIDTSSVLRSAQSRQTRADTTQLEAQASPQDREDYSFMFKDQ